MVYLAYRHAVNATQGTQVNDVIALLEYPSASATRLEAGRNTESSAFSLVGWLP